MSTSSSTTNAPATPLTSPSIVAARKWTSPSSSASAPATDRLEFAGTAEAKRPKIDGTIFRCEPLEQRGQNNEFRFIISDVVYDWSCFVPVPSRYNLRHQEPRTIL